MHAHDPAADLPDELVAEYGDRLPDTLIRSTVQAALLTRQHGDDAELSARQDVAALAAAALRRPEPALAS